MPTKVDDIMTRKVLTIASDARLEDAAWGLALKRVAGAAVKDDRGRVIGILSKSDIGVIERLAAADSLKASDAMARVLYAVRQGDTVKHAASRFIDTGAHHLIVLDADDNMVGTITQSDLLKLLLRDDVDL
jgi:CBS domain-containing membrane protein